MRAVVLALFCAGGCGRVGYETPKWASDGPGRDGGGDASAFDAGREDGARDGGSLDGAVMGDGGERMDAGIDGAPSDGGARVDGGSMVDAGLVDAGLVDAGLVDAGLVDAGSTDAGADGSMTVGWPTSGACGTTYSVAIPFDDRADDCQTYPVTYGTGYSCLYTVDTCLGTDAVDHCTTGAREIFVDPEDTTTGRVWVWVDDPVGAFAGIVGGPASSPICAESSECVGRGTSNPVALGENHVYLIEKSGGCGEVVVEVAFEPGPP